MSTKERLLTVLGAFVLVFGILWGLGKLLEGIGIL